MEKNSQNEINIQLTEDFAAAHGTREAIFDYIYQNNVWRDPESVSGRGSSVKATEVLRRQLEVFLETNSIQSVIDIPCGDYNWFKEIGYPLKSYIGYDIVPELISENTRLYGSPSRQFRQANVLQSAIDDADLLICRDFVIHSSYKDIFTFFANLERSNIPNILLSHYQNCSNTDIFTGNRYRPIDFTQVPFALPCPESLLDEQINHMRDTAEIHQVDGQLEKYLAHWKTAAIFDALSANPQYIACKNSINKTTEQLRYNHG